MGVEDHLLALAHIGPREHHPAVTEPDMCDLHRDRRACDDHNLMAPVELVGLARLVIERHISLSGGGAAPLRPGLREATNGVIATLVAERPHLLEDPDQGQPFSGRLACVRAQKLLDLLLPGADPRQGLAGPLVAEFRLIRPKDLPHRVPRHVQLPRDLLHRPTLDVEGPPDPRDRIHPLHPLLRLLTRSRRSDEI